MAAPGPAARSSEMVLGGELEPGQPARIDARAGRLEFEVLEGEEAAVSEAEQAPVPT